MFKKMMKRDLGVGKGREKKPSEEMLPDKAAGYILENTFLFFMFSFSC